MRIRVWNAYASNNSGSYTIVGSLPSAEVAEEVAAEFKAVIDAQTAWFDERTDLGDGSNSPLAAFCRAHGLTWETGRGGYDDWPQHSADNRPRVAVIGRQVVVHHEYTVSLPPTFGEFFYKRGGRVDHEEVHAHHPMVATITFWWAWTEEGRAKARGEIPRIVEALTADDGIFATLSSAWWPAAWHGDADDWHAAPLTVGIVFENLVEGISALRTLALVHGAEIQVRLNESPDESSDPLTHLRPSSPPPAVPRFDLVIRDAGQNRAVLTTAVSELFSVGTYDVPELLARIPCTIARGMGAARAEAAAIRLREAGAAVELVRNDH